MTRPPKAFTLADLLDQEELGLELLSGPATARVVGAHVVEIERPATWLERDWIMLTTGVRLRRRAQEQRRLVAELEAAGAAGLGFGTDLVFRKVPAALLEEARARDFPVFAVPLRTPFREIVGAVNRALAGSELRAMQRLSSIQLQLMDALADEEPERAVLARLASILDATVLRFGADGTVEAATGEAPAGAIWAAITAHPAVLVEFELDGRHTVATPIAGRPGFAAEAAPRGGGALGAPVGWLAAITDHARDRITRPAVRATAPVLAALAHISDAAQRQDRAIRAAVLEQVLAPADPDAGTLAARAASLGLDFVQPARIVLARGELQLDRPHLSARRGELTVALVQGDVRAAVAEPAAIGRPVSRLEDVPHSLRDAELALRRGVLDYADFDLATLLVAESPRERIEPKAAELLGGLREHPGLQEALAAYFDHGLDVMRAAAAMHVHHNTLRYRLARVEERLGRSLKDPATIASLYIALAYDDHASP